MEVGFNVNIEISGKVTERLDVNSWFASAAAAISVTRMGAQPSAPTRKEIDEFVDELKDRFGTPPPEVIALTQETRIRCLAEEAGFDMLEVRKNEIYCRLIKRGKEGTKHYYRKAGQIPKLSSKEPLLKLNETIRFQKLVSHGNKN